MKIDARSVWWGLEGIVASSPYTTSSWLLVGGNSDAFIKMHTLVARASYVARAALTVPTVMKMPDPKPATSTAMPRTKYTARYVWLAACVPAASAATVASDHTDSHQFWLTCADEVWHETQHAGLTQRRRELSVRWQRGVCGAGNEMRSFACSRWSGLLKERWTKADHVT